MYLETRFCDAIRDWFTPDYKKNEMSNFLWCCVTKRVIDSPTVRVRNDDSDSDDDEEEDFCAPLIGKNPEHYVDTGYDFETLNGVSDIPPEFQLDI